MNYSMHYFKLIDRARNRDLPDYYEKHHVCPKCLGGSDKDDNIVKLTPEEHYIAHLLLVKIYPNNPKLIYAANMMTVSMSNHKRKNKSYGWLKKKFIDQCKKRTGYNNPSYGKLWYYDPYTKVNGKFSERDVPLGFVKGRYYPPKPKTSNCANCSIRFNPKKSEKYCSVECKPSRSEITKKCIKSEAQMWNCCGVRKFQIL